MRIRSSRRGASRRELLPGLLVLLLLLPCNNELIVITLTRLVDGKDKGKEMKGGRKKDSVSRMEVVPSHLQGGVHLLT